MNRQLTFLLWDDDSFNWRWSVGYFDLYRRRSRCKNARSVFAHQVVAVNFTRKIYHLQDYAVSLQLKLFGTVPRIFKNRRLKDECIDTTASDNY